MQKVSYLVKGTFLKLKVKTCNDFKQGPTSWPACQK